MSAIRTKPIRFGTTAVDPARAMRAGTIALVGAECTGKTTLAQALAAELPALWLPEALRAFCEREGRTPRPDEQLGLMREQMAGEAAARERAAREGIAWVVCDSTPLVTALYSVMLFEDHSLLGPALEHQRGHTLTLLADVDLPWVADGIQRDGPQARAAFHALLLETLRAHRLPFRFVSGAAGQRLAGALQALRACV